MTISLIVPIYNVEGYIRKCLDSLLCQQQKSFEIICVDDESTDASAEIVKEYTNKYSQIIRLTQIPHGGLSRARNKGIEMASGDYIGFVDSDDWLSPDWSKIIFDVLVKEKPDILVFNYTEVHKSGNRPINDKCYGNRIAYESSVCNKLFKKKLFDENHIEFMPGVKFEDNDVIYRLLYYSHNTMKINEPLYYYRRTRQQSIMNSVGNSNHIYDMNLVMKHLYNFVSSQQVSKEDLSEYEFIFIRNLIIRQLPKIVQYEAPNLVRLTGNIAAQFKMLKSYFPNWKNNPIYLTGADGYLIQKLGRRYKMVLGILDHLLS